MNITRKTVRAPCEIVFPDGRRFVSFNDITSYDDWRDTPFGPWNFGHVHIGPTRYVIEHPDGTQVPTTPEYMAVTEARREYPLSNEAKPRSWFQRLISFLRTGSEGR